MWQAVTRAIDPVKAKPRVSGPPRVASAHGAAPMRTPGAAPSQERAPQAQPPELTPLDRRQARLIATGRVAIGARLDLHGCQEREAHGRLHAFLHAAQREGHTTVLIITGKGGRAAEDDAPAAMDARPRGVLRRSVPRWLREPELRTLVVSFGAASPRHGGAGAIYVRLRRAAER